MSQHTVYIDFRRETDHWGLVSLFNEVQSALTGDSIHLTIDFRLKNLFVYADHLLVVVAMVHHLRDKGVSVDIEVLGRSEYASRINFLRLLGVHDNEGFLERQTTGKFIELFRFTNDSKLSIQDDLTMIIHQMGNVAIEVKQLIFYCLNEIMDNVLVHSRQEAGWVAAQVFQNRHEIRLVICDTGIGVLESLRSSGKAEFIRISEAQALEASIQRGITDGSGVGFGLYATSQFIIFNRGDMLLYSGNHCLQVGESGRDVLSGAMWPGTVVALRIRTDIPVDYKAIMPQHHTLPDDYQFFIDKYFGENNELW